MSEIEFLCFTQVNPDDFMAVLNEDSLRTHLIDHPYFDATSLQAWIEGKINTDAMHGCRIRAVYIDGVLAGWCGIQPDNSGFELAIVISQKFWGCGIQIFGSKRLLIGGHVAIQYSGSRYRNDASIILYVSPIP